jgi:hypothetical protein
VTGQHALGVAVGIVLEEFKGEPLRLIVALRNDRQAETEQGVQHATFCHLQAEPGHGITPGGKIGNHLVQPARAAKIAGIAGRHGPVADTHAVVIRAQPIACRFRIFQFRSPHSVIALGQCRHEAAVGQEGERAVAVETAYILEENQILAMGTVKCFHWPSRCETVHCL